MVENIDIFIITILCKTYTHHSFNKYLLKVSYSKHCNKPWDTAMNKILGPLLLLTLHGLKDLPSLQKNEIIKNHKSTKKNHKST